MSTIDANKIQLAENIVNSFDTNVTIKRVKKDNGLIERTNLDNNKVILTEDNRQIIFG